MGGTGFSLSYYTLPCCRCYGAEEAAVAHRVVSVDVVDVRFYGRASEMAMGCLGGGNMALLFDR